VSRYLPVASRREDPDRISSDARFGRLVRKGKRASATIDLPKRSLTCGNVRYVRLPGQYLLEFIW